MSFLIGPGEGHQLGGKFDVVVRVRAEHTGGVMAVIEETIPPGALITPHTHRNDVWVHVLTGEIGVLVGEQTAAAGPGAWALKPRNVVHAMWNPTATSARIIEVLTPGGSERWFEETAELQPGDTAGFEASCQRHGIEFFPDSPWLQKLRTLMRH
jgi:quercetin dioxygenase-like cupin family protein